MLIMRIINNVMILKLYFVFCILLMYSYAPTCDGNATFYSEHVFMYIVRYPVFRAAQSTLQPDNHVHSSCSTNSD